MKKILFCLFVFIAVFHGCTGKGIIVGSKRTGQLDCITIESPILGKNKIKDPGEKTIYVALPPQYDISQDRYPVIYYLHGYGADSYEIFTFAEVLNFAIQQAKIPPFILVAASGNNSLGGTFYVNSDYTGHWEDHFIKELIPAIDKQYRTFSSVESRGLLGFSMGGFGALHIGLKYPGYFAAVYALCPGVFIPDKGLVDAMPRWKNMGNFLKAYASAFCHVQKIPVFDGSPEDAGVIKEWESGFGNWEYRVSGYLQQQDRIKSIKIGFAEYDQFSWITDGSKYLADYMQQQGLPVELRGFAMGHSITPNIVLDDILPYFRMNLSVKIK